MQSVRDTVREERLDAAVGEEHFEAVATARRRIALPCRGQVFAHFSHEAAKHIHGAKNGVLM
jgi:hypothetical protein